MTTKKVLVVEDHEDNAEAIAEFIRFVFTDWTVECTAGCAASASTCWTMADERLVKFCGSRMNKDDKSTSEDRFDRTSTPSMGRSFFCKRDVVPKPSELGGVSYSTISLLL